VAVQPQLTEVRVSQTTTAIAKSDLAWHCLFAWSAFLIGSLAYPLLLSHYSRANSPTFNEGMHIAAGHRYWECGDYAINPEHPPLLKLIAAAPLRSWHFDVYASTCGTSITDNMHLIGAGYQLMNTEFADQILAKARKAATLFSVLLLVTIFFATRAWFGHLAAGCAVILTVFEPNLTAHGPLVATDMAATATTFATVFCADRYLRKPALWRLLLLGLLLGFALASKHTAVFIPFILLIQFLAYFFLHHSNKSHPALSRLLLAWFASCLLAVLVLWSTYQFRYSSLPAHSQGFDIAKTLETDGRSDTIFGHAIGIISHFHLLPESYVAGLLYVMDNSIRTSYIFGQRHDTGVWYYFPITILIKTPLTILLLVGIAIASPPLWRKHKTELVVALIPIALFLFSAMTSKINLGVRHILPVYSFLIVLAASAIGYYASRSTSVAVGCAALLLFQVASYTRSFPNEIAYANETWGGPRNLYKFLGDSSVDWGQALYRVRDYTATQDITDCWIAWFGGRKPSVAGLPCRTLAGPGYVEAGDAELPPILPEKFSGTVFISNTLLDYDIYPYLFFAKREPDDVIAGSILVYHADFDVPEIAAERRASRGWWYLNHQQATQAVEEFAAAEPHAFGKGGIHSLYAWALLAAGRSQEARRMYEQAAVDYVGKPADAQWRKSDLAAAAALRQAETNHASSKK
jgi:hypothetical protein